MNKSSTVGVARAIRGYAYAFMLCVAAITTPCRALDLDRNVNVDVAAQPLAAALAALSRQAHIQISMSGSGWEDLSSRALSGTFTVKVALETLLVGTGMNYYVTGDSSISVSNVPHEPADRLAAQHAPVNSEANSTQLTGVSVTANKRDENERKIAGSLTALTGRQLQDIGAQDFADYLTAVPGVQFNQEVPGQSVASIRGVSTANSTSSNQSPIGIFFEEVPLTDPFASVYIPDIDAFDVGQIEILRGPQGALFGSGALGGAINYIPTRTDLGEADARAEGSGTIGHDSLLGGAAKGMINVPIVQDSFGIRAAGFMRYEPGYINNVGTGRNHSNDTEVGGGRVLADWRVGPGTTLSFTALYQRSHVGDQGYENLGLPAYQKSTGVAENYLGRINVDDLRLESDLGFAKLVGIGAYQYKHLYAQQDVTYLFDSSFGSAATALLGPATNPVASNLHGYTTELRLVSPASQHFEWLAGVFYADRQEGLSDTLNALGLAPFDSSTDLLTTALAPILGPTLSGELAPLLTNTDTLLNVSVNTKIVEKAAYADASYKFGGGHWKISAGGREYRNRVNENTLLSGVYLLLNGLEYSQANNGVELDTGFNPRVSLSYTPSDNFLFYALGSRGYALGGVNYSPPQAGFAPPLTYGPSKLYNTEIGAKTAWFHHRLLVDITPFYLYWKNIPLTITPSSGLAYQDNVGGAHNMGVEAAITALPFKHFVVTNTVTYVRADLSNDYNAGGGQAIVPQGTPLPGTPRWQGSTVATYRWPMYGLPWHISFINRYIGPSSNSLQFVEPRQGAFDTMSIREGFKLSNFGVELFSDNLTDRRGVASTIYNSPSNIRNYIIQPRTVGLKVSWDLD